MNNECGIPTPIPPSHFDGHDYHDVVGDYKHLKRYGAVGDTDGITLGFEIECEWRGEYEFDDIGECECCLEDEYECECGARDAEHINESAHAALGVIDDSMNRGYVLAERDGSLADTGVEFITGHCTWESHKPRLERFFSAYRKKFEASSSAGIHIHVGRADLDVSWTALYWFIMCNKNAPLIEHVARRYAGRFCGANRQYLKEGKITFPDRYDAVNKRTDTYEFRLFDSTTDWTQMQEYAEFCLATVEFLIQNNTSIVTWMFGDSLGAAPVDFTQSPMHYPRFIEWVSTQAVRFPNLNTHLEKLK